MRPLTLVLTAVMTVAGVYAVFFWRNASDVRERLKTHQANEHEIQELAATDPRSGLTRGARSPGAYASSASRPGPSGAGAVASTDSTASEAASAASSGIAENSTTDAAAESAVDQSAEQKQRNYDQLEGTALQIASAIQRQMRESEILSRGRGVGAALMRRGGYSVGDNGVHTSAAGNFSTEIKGPDLIVVSGESSAHQNQLEVSIIGPREVDRTVRRLR